MRKIRDVKIIELGKFFDERGYLVKVIKKEYVSKKLGEIYVTITKPGFIKANHYHRKTTEWFCILRGKCLLLLRDRNTGSKMRIKLDSNKPQLIKIPPFVEHATKNIGKDDMMLFAYADEPYDPSDTLKSNIKF